MPQFLIENAPETITAKVAASMQEKKEYRFNYLRCTECDQSEFDISINGSANKIRFSAGRWLRLPVGLMAEGFTVYNLNAVELNASFDLAGDGAQMGDDRAVYSGVGLFNLSSVTPGVNLDVNVTNHPASQTVDGTVNIGNLPASQTVDGTVNIGNFPTSQTVNPEFVPSLDSSKPQFNMAQNDYVEIGAVAAYPSRYKVKIFNTGAKINVGAGGVGASTGYILNYDQEHEIVTSGVVALFNPVSTVATVCWEKISHYEFN
nr:hypothetical protein 13 [bacterium]